VIGVRWGSSELSVSDTNFSKASPGPSFVHLSWRSLDTLSNDRPMLSSLVVASSLNDFSDVAKTRSVCPPDIRSVRNGNLGSFG
jgi:hypothetical protein